MHRLASIPLRCRRSSTKHPPLRVLFTGVPAHGIGSRRISQALPTESAVPRERLHIKISWEPLYQSKLPVRTDGTAAPRSADFRPTERCSSQADRKENDRLEVAHRASTASRKAGALNSGPGPAFTTSVHRRGRKSGVSWRRETSRCSSNGVSARMGATGERGRYKASFLRRQADRQTKAETPPQSISSNAAAERNSRQQAQRAQWRRRFRNMTKGRDPSVSNEHSTR
ncbi:hypothetical protein B0H17DRAFT_1082141 [Mycena rosella]|uniref:Uncharacterized protein n=1 Tax=Mycena rosella TaxID=1033263 RepID=A0AAD7D1K8_MYCRO|nr:hypothetical protein B0H17DRAFT_1082141 [Mycena rosella]